MTKRETVNKIFKYIRCLIPLVVALGTQIIGLYAYALYEIIKGANETGVINYDVQEVLGSMNTLNAIAVYECIALVVFFVWYKCFLKYRFSYRKGKLPGKIWGFLLLGFTGTEAVLSCFLLLAQKFAPDLMNSYANMMEASGLTELSVLSTILTLVGAPVVEEIAFRGITMTWAYEASGKFWVANIIQAALFGIAHLDIVQGTYAFIMGLLLGFVAHKYKSIGVSIFGHLVFNFSGTYLVAVLYGFSETVSPIRMAFVFAIGAVVSVISFMYMKNDVVEE